MKPTQSALQYLRDVANRRTGGKWVADGRDVCNSDYKRIVTVDGGYFPEGKDGDNQESDALFISTAAGSYDALLDVAQASLEIEHYDECQMNDWNIEIHGPDGICDCGLSELKTALTRLKYAAKAARGEVGE